MVRRRNYFGGRLGQYDGRGPLQHDKLILATVSALDLKKNKTLNTFSYKWCSAGRINQFTLCGNLPVLNLVAAVVPAVLVSMLIMLFGLVVFACGAVLARTIVFRLIKFVWLPFAWC